MPTAVAPLVLAFPTRLPAIRLNDDAAAPATSWIQVAVVGDYEDARYGKFSITSEMLNAMVLNFAEGRFPEPPTEICVDYDHLTTKESKIPGDGKAAAWFKELQTRDNGTTLWARVEWTPAGADAVKSGEYKFFSPYFTTNFETNKGEEIGPCLINGAITNRPFLQGMQPLSLALSAAKQAKNVYVALATLTDSDKRARIAYAIEQRYGAWRDEYYGWDVWFVDTVDGKDAIFCRYGRNGTPAAHYIVGYTIGDDGSVSFTGEPEEVVNNWARLSAGNGGKELMAKTFTLTAADGKTVTITEEQLETLDVIKALRAQVPAKDQKVVAAADYDKLTSDFKALSSTVDALKTESAANKAEAEKANKALAQKEAEAKVDVLLKAGKVTPAQKDHFIELALSNAEMFDKITKDMPVAVKLDTVAGSADAAASDKATQLAAAAAAIRTADPKLSAEQATAKALEQNPDLYEG